MRGQHMVRHTPPEARCMARALMLKRPDALHRAHLSQSLLCPSPNNQRAIFCLKLYIARRTLQWGGFGISYGATGATGGVGRQAIPVRE